MRGWLLIALFVGSACVTTRPAPLGLKTDPAAIAKAEQQTRDAAKVREVAAAVAGIMAGIGGVVFLGSQLQPVQTAPSTNEPSIAGFQTATQQLQQRALDNRDRDRAISAGLLVGGLGVFLGACVASAIVDDGASEWLLEQREQEQRELTPTESQANRELLEAALEAQKRPTEPGGRTLRPGQRRARRTAVQGLQLMPGP
ncbi:MAG: hypothetical protein Q8N26_09425 [Myxococcales bacterium]|nr:hypothetical protein [Myxococcales bacterium]